MLEIYFWNGRFLFKGNEFSGNYHKHHPLQIIASVKEEITVSAGSGIDICSPVLLIDSNVEHVCKNHKTSISIFIDPETDEGRALKQMSIPGSVRPLPFTKLIHMHDDFESFRRAKKSDCAIAGTIFKKILFSYIDIHTGIPRADARIEKVLSLIPHIPDKKMSVKNIASEVNLSETRLIHLFKETIGMPIRRYLLWKRLIDAIIFIKNGRTLTMAALEAGFSDYAHFSRTFKHMFGSKVENIFKNDQFVQAYYCEK